MQLGGDTVTPRQKRSSGRQNGEDSKVTAGTAGQFHELYRLRVQGWAGDFAYSKRQGNTFILRLLF